MDCRITLHRAGGPPLATPPRPPYGLGPPQRPGSSPPAPRLTTPDSQRRLPACQPIPQPPGREYIDRTSGPVRPRDVALERTRRHLGWRLSPQFEATFRVAVPGG